MDIPSLHAILLKEYGPQGWWPLFDVSSDQCSYRAEYTEGHFNDEERFEVCIGALLTQNTSWKNAEKSLRELCQKGALSPAALLEMDTSRLSSLIRSSVYYNVKAKRLKSFASFYLSLCGRIPLRQELLAQSGIGEETCDSMLLYAWGEPVFVCDAYTRRLLKRLGLACEDISYAQMQSLFHNAYEKSGLTKQEILSLYREYHALIVRHSVFVCTSKPSCMGCPLKGACIHDKV